MRPLSRLDMSTIRPLTNLVKIPTHMLRFRANRHLRPRNPLPRGSPRIRMAEDIPSHCFQTMVDVVPFSEIDSAVGVHHGRVVASGIDVAAEDREAVQNVEDGQAYEVIIGVAFCRCVLSCKGELGRRLSVDPDIVALYIVVS